MKKHDRTSQAAPSAAGKRRLSPEAARRRRLKKRRRELRDWIVSLALALIAVLFIRSSLFMIVRVDGRSMNDTLADGEFMFVTIPDAKLGTSRGDVVICRYPNRGNVHFVKRVVAVPGDQVYRENGATHVVYSENGMPVDEALDEGRNAPSSNDYEAYTLAADEYFVAGDNRSNSHDSRNWNDRTPADDVGPISGDMIVGHVKCVIWPPDQIRPVE